MNVIATSEHEYVYVIHSIQLITRHRYGMVYGVVRFTCATCLYDITTDIPQLVVALFDNRAFNSCHRHCRITSPTWCVSMRFSRASDYTSTAKSEQVKKCSLCRIAI